MKIVTLNFIYYFFLLLLNTNISMMMEEVHDDFPKELIDKQSAPWEKIKQSNPLLGIFNVALTSEYTYHKGKMRILLADNEQTGCIEFLKNLFGLNNKETKKLRNCPRFGDAYYWKDIACNIAGRTVSIVSVSLLWYLFYNFLNNVFNKLSPSNKNFQFTFEWNPKSAKTAILVTIFFTWLCTKIIKCLHDIVGLHNDYPHENYGTYNYLFMEHNKKYTNMEDSTFVNMLNSINNIVSKKKNKSENWHEECEQLRELHRLFRYLKKYKNREEYNTWNDNYSRSVASSKLQINPYITESITESKVKEGSSGKDNPYIPQSTVRVNSLDDNSYPPEGTREEKRLSYTPKEEMNTRKNRIEREENPLPHIKESMNTRKNRIKFLFNEITTIDNFLFDVNFINVLDHCADSIDLETIEQVETYLESHIINKINTLKYDDRKVYREDLEERCKEYCWQNNEDNLFRIS